MNFTKQDSHFSRRDDCFIKLTITGQDEMGTLVCQIHVKHLTLLMTQLKENTNSINPVIKLETHPVKKSIQRFCALNYYKQD